MKQEIIDKAKAGDVEAMFRLAGHLYSGRSVAQSYSLARQWYEAAAEKGHMQATYEFGLMLEAGLGGEKDETKAVEYFQKAAEANVAEAKVELGIIYSRGIGVKKNYVRAMKYLREAGTYEAAVLLRDAPDWWESAAKQGIPEAEYQLGLCYMNGYGLNQDYATGRYWLLCAAKHDSAKAYDALAQMYMHGLGVTKSENNMLYCRKCYCDIKGVDYEQFDVTGDETIDPDELDFTKITLPDIVPSAPEKEIEIVNTPLNASLKRENRVVKKK